MLRKLTERDRERVMEFILPEPSFNAFFIGDVENFGFDFDFQEIWADLDSEGHIRTLMLRFYTNNVVYTKNKETLNGKVVPSFLKRIPGKWVLSGKEWIVDELSNSVAFERIDRQYLAELTSGEFLEPTNLDVSVERANEYQFRQVVKLHRGIEEFSRFGDNTEAVEYNHKSGTGRTIVVEIDNHVVSCASSAAESSQTAVIIGVATASEYRGRGYATACVAGLCKELLREGKTVCLFYDNPAAARIYKRLGFRDIGRWSMAQFEVQYPW